MDLRRLKIAVALKLILNEFKPMLDLFKQPWPWYICIDESKLHHNWYHNFKYALVGIIFGMVLVKSEVISWYRIQEMFRLQQFHMYGVIGRAVVIGMVSIALIKRFSVKTIYGEPIVFQLKKWNKGQVYGGLIFGFGWALTGACPGPMYALLGYSSMIALILLLSAVAGTWIYGYFRNKLPH